MCVGLLKRVFLVTTLLYCFGASAAAVDMDPKRFVAIVLAKTEDVWLQLFRGFGRKYEMPKLVLFDKRISTKCGQANSAQGPFYCPLDRKIYMDLSFFDELGTRFRVTGDFPRAYVIAHEVAHHVQTLLGISEIVQRAKLQRSLRQANAIQVGMELQADCLAGVWAAQSHMMKSFLEPGDIERGLETAAAIGDDRIQKQTIGQIIPEAFTHGSSAERAKWLRKGFETGQIRSCDTFSIPGVSIL